MSVSLRFSSVSELDSAIQKLADAAGGTVKEVLPAQMRLFAADLAFNTRPIGKTASAQKEGQAKVIARIQVVYPSVGMMAEFLRAKEERLKIAFISRIKKKQYSAAKQLLNDIFTSSYEIGEFDGGELHREQQFKRKVNKRLVVIDQNKVTQYIREVKKRVGFAKGGFATAARELGGVRGIPGFVTRQNAPGSGKVAGDKNTLTVTMENRVRYIEDALDAHGEARAIEHRKRSVESVIKRMMGRKTKSASKSLK